MIPRFAKSGTSFAGALRYAMHDPNAETQERVAWTHTQNLANDFIPAAVNEMIWTSRDAELLKQDAGVRGGGRPSAHTVKHVSLNWHPDDNPSQKHMIATAQHFLKEMGWGEHQAIFVAHNDKQYKHVHIYINEVHPGTGLKLDDGFERRRAQKWAAAYEFEQGIIRCEQRQLSPEQRQQNMPRNIWLEFQQSEKQFQKFEANFQKFAEMPEPHPPNRKSVEWEIFKGIQEDQRLAFVKEGKQKFKEMRAAVYREVREEFRDRWSRYYRAEKAAVRERESLPETKASIVADQMDTLNEKRDRAMGKLKKERDLEYKQLLAKQRDVRAEFRRRVNAGMDNAEFLDALDKEIRQPEMVNAFKEAAHEVTARVPYHAPRKETEFEQEGRGIDWSLGMRIPGQRRAAAMVGSILDSLFGALTLGGVHESRGAEGFTRDEIEIAAEEATKRALQEARDASDEDWRKRQNESWRTENDRGTGPATPASPSPLATHSNDQSDDFLPYDDGSAEAEISREFRRRLDGARLLPVKERAPAYRAAREWLRSAMTALREKRVYERAARREIRRRTTRGKPASDLRPG